MRHYEMIVSDHFKRQTIWFMIYYVEKRASCCLMEMREIERIGKEKKIHTKENDSTRIISIIRIVYMILQTHR